MSIRHVLHITTVPPGEAPEWVRLAWVDVRIPILRSQITPTEFRVCGVLSGPRTFFAQLRNLLLGRTERWRGYRVRVIDAVEALEASQPEAARWWRENTARLFSKGGSFVFPEHSGVIEVLDGAYPLAQADHFSLSAQIKNKKEKNE